MEGAVSIKAEVSAELLVAIFQNSSPIHDGAVIVGDGKLLAAGCFVPVMIDGKHDRRLGTRHLAAIGLSKETDAYVVVVSEERGEISVVENGRLVRNVSAQELREALRAAFDLSAVRSNLNEEGGSDAVET